MEVWRSCLHSHRDFNHVWLSKNFGIVAPGIVFDERCWKDGDFLIKAVGAGSRPWRFSRSASHRALVIAAALARGCFRWGDAGGRLLCLPEGGDWHKQELQGQIRGVGKTIQIQTNYSPTSKLCRLSRRQLQASCIQNNRLMNHEHEPLDRRQLVVNHHYHHYEFAT